MGFPIFLLLAILLNVIVSLNFAPAYAAQPGSVGALAPFASGTSPTPPEQGIDVRVINDPKFEHCNNECIYNRARESITLQIDYNLKKKEYLENPNNSEANRRKMLGAFCGEPRDPGGEPEDIDDCSKRWIQVNQFWLLKARGALAGNQDAIAKLAGVTCNGGVCTLPRPDEEPPTFQRGSALPGSPQSSMQEQKYHQAPAFSTGNDLARAQQNKNWDAIGKVQDNGAWGLNAIKQLKPELQDFIKFRQIPRDPNFPQGEMLEVPWTTRVGNQDMPVYDTEQYNLAMKAYRETFGKSAGGLGEGVLDETMRKVENLSQRAKQDRAEMIENFRVSTTTPEPNKDPKRVIYDEARNQIVNELNHFVQTTKYDQTSGRPTRAKPGTTVVPPVVSSAPDNHIRYSPVSQQEGEVGFSSSISWNAGQITFAPVNGVERQRPSTTPGAVKTPTTTAKGPVAVGAVGAGSRTPSALQQQSGVKPALPKPIQAPSLDQVTDTGGTEGPIHLNFN